MWIISDVLISEPHHVFGTSNVFNGVGVPTSRPAVWSQWLVVVALPWKRLWYIFPRAQKQFANGMIIANWYHGITIIGMFFTCRCLKTHTAIITYHNHDLKFTNQSSFINLSSTNPHTVEAQNPSPRSPMIKGY